MRHQMIGLSVAALMLAGGTVPALAQDAKATEILAAARKAIGDKKLEALKTLSVEASVQRNLGSMQMQTETEMLLELPDKYVRSDVSSGAMSMSMATGFNGDRAILPAGASVGPGGGMMIRMGSGPAGADPHAGAKPTPEELEQMHRLSVRNARHEISRMMLGWFASTHPSLKAQYTYAGEAESPDGKAYVIDVKDDDGFAARLFIDQISKLPLMVTYKGRQGRVVTNTLRPGGARVTTSGEGRPQQLTEEEAKKLTVDFTFFFEDWREIDGVNFPHIVRRASEGATNEEWKINKVKVNPKLDAKKFAVGTN